MDPELPHWLLALVIVVLGASLAAVAWYATSRTP